MRGIIQTPGDIGEVVKTVRISHGLSQEALSQQLGISQRYLSELERGKAKILDSRYLSVLRKLGVTMSYETHE